MSFQRRIVALSLSLLFLPIYPSYDKSSSNTGYVGSLGVPSRIKKQLEGHQRDYCDMRDKQYRDSRCAVAALGPVASSNPPAAVAVAGGAAVVAVAALPLAIAGEALGVPGAKAYKEGFYSVADRFSNWLFGDKPTEKEDPAIQASLDKWNIELKEREKAELAALVAAKPVEIAPAPVVRPSIQLSPSILDDADENFKRAFLIYWGYDPDTGTQYSAASSSSSSSSSSEPVVAYCPPVHVGSTTSVKSISLASGSLVVKDVITLNGKSQGGSSGRGSLGGRRAATSGGGDDNDPNKGRKSNSDKDFYEFKTEIRQNYTYDNQKRQYTIKENGTPIQPKVHGITADHTHKDYEAYDKSGKHMGSINPKTKEIYKEPVADRTVTKTKK